MEAHARVPASANLAPTLEFSPVPEPSLSRPFYRDGSVADRLAAGATLDGARLLEIARVAIQGITELHVAGVVHGDPSPVNLMLMPGAQTVLLADPCSSRRAFASFGSTSPTAVEDEVAILRWVVSLARMLRDPVAHQLTQLLTDSRDAAAAFLLLSKMTASTRLVPPGAPLLLEPGSDVSPDPQPVTVEFNFNPVPGEREQYLLGKTLAARIGGDPLRWRRALAAGGGLSVSFPEPAHSLSAAFTRENCKFTLKEAGPGAGQATMTMAPWERGAPARVRENLERSFP
jgi:serine/threonine protein kinase